MKDIRQRLLAAFDTEYREHLTAIRRILPVSSADGNPLSDADLTEAIRRAHSLKGAARAVDIRTVEAVAHRLETLLVRAQKRDVALDATTFPVVHQALDHIEDLVGTAIDPSLPEVSLDLTPLDRLLGQESAPPPATLPPVPVPTPAPAPAPRAAARGEETVRIGAANLDLMLHSTGQLSTELARQAVHINDIRKLHQEMSEVVRDWQQFRRTSSQPLRELAASPDYGRIVTHIEAMEARMTVLARDIGRIGKAGERNAWTLHRLVDELQSEVRHVRLVPAEHVFGTFSKMVRDLAREHGRQVEIQIRGLEVEADRAILQQLKDPVMHVLRNAVGHGVETPEERTASGKPPLARILLDIAVAGGRLVVRVEDDGRGLDFRKIRETAIAQGLLDREAAASPETLSRMLLRPGFSTAATVDTLSGRGVGLSVLHEAVSRLRGVIDIRPAPTGTVVEITTPLSVSRQNLLLVSSGGQVYALPGFVVERLLRIDGQSITTEEGRPVLLLEERTIPLVPLWRKLGYGKASASSPSPQVPIVVLRVGERR
ncbi:MAG: chemotaxis protein CheA, partial [Alphaproteobacteria bacterium]